MTQYYSTAGPASTPQRIPMIPIVTLQGQDYRYHLKDDHDPWSARTDHVYQDSVEEVLRTQGHSCA